MLALPTKSINMSWPKAVRHISVHKQTLPLVLPAPNARRPQCAAATRPAWRAILVSAARAACGEDRCSSSGRWDMRSWHRAMWWA